MKNQKNRRAGMFVRLLLAGFPLLASVPSNAQTQPQDITNLRPDIGKVIVIPFDDLVVGAVKEGKNTPTQQTIQYHALARLVRVIDPTNGAPL